MNMQDEVVKILTYYHGENNFNMNPLVPREIEHYARAVLDIPDEDIIMAAMRTSFTKFHRGLIISRDGIYWQNDHKVETDVNCLCWRELSDRRSSFRAQRTTVTLGENTVIDNTGSHNKPSTIINLLDLFIDLYDKQMTDSDGFDFDEDNLGRIIRSIPDNKASLKEENSEAAAGAATVTFFALIAGIFKKMLGK